MDSSIIWNIHAADKVSLMTADVPGETNYYCRSYSKDVLDHLRSTIFVLIIVDDYSSDGTVAIAARSM
jgi:hypothetical protein